MAEKALPLVKIVVPDFVPFFAAMERRFLQRKTQPWLLNRSRGEPDARLRAFPP
jgi:hypothetical protein